MNERFPDIEGAACADLPPFVVAKYFNINTHTQVWEKKTAKAICGNCAVQALCLEAAVAQPQNQIQGITAGLTAGEIKAVRKWRDYDLGRTDTPPDRPRPAIARADLSDADRANIDYRRTAKLTFEERVRGVFIDLRNGKYNETGGVSQAIGAIAFIREQMDANATADKRAAA
ncbi:hypothetical protein B5P43_18300 [Bacillus sp. SRB_336]|nr:hypothetical protein B5P43_18300 [Bacillus sp. SRB_336]